MYVFKWELGIFLCFMNPVIKSDFKTYGSNSRSLHSIGCEYVYFTNKDIHIVTNEYVLYVSIEPTILLKHVQ